MCLAQPSKQARTDALNHREVAQVDELRTLAAKAENDHRSAKKLRAGAEKVHDAVKRERTRLKAKQAKLAAAADAVRAQGQRLARERLDIAQQRKDLRETRSTSPPLRGELQTAQATQPQPHTEPLSVESSVDQQPPMGSSTAMTIAGSYMGTEDGYCSIASRFRSSAFGATTTSSSSSAVPVLQRRRERETTLARSPAATASTQMSRSTMRTAFTPGPAARATSAAKENGNGNSSLAFTPPPSTMSTADQLKELRDEQQANEAFLTSMYL